MEKTLEEYIKKLLAITGELKRVLKPTGVMFWNHGDCYGGNRAKSTPTKTGQVGNQKKDLCPKFNKNIQAKSLALQNYRLILQMINQGWILRNTIIWNKPNHMPSSVKDRFANSYEPVFMLVKRKKYWFDLDAVRKPYTEPMDRWGGEKLEAKGQSNWDKGTGQETYRNRDMRPNKSGKNPGDVWTIPTQPFPEAHFATFPEKLVEPMILSSCPKEICKKCGKARVRIVKTDYKPSENKWGKQTRLKGKTKGENVRYNENLSAIHQTIGWTDCKCKAGWKPGITLDPFLGSGTVAVVAKRLGRNYLGIELSKEYIKIAEQRIKAQPHPLL